MDIKGRYIIDDQGRTLILRGCNLGGDSKYPVSPEGETWKPDSLKNPETVSFVGRPFPLEDAEAHFERLRRWGLTFIRFLITWEALEHAGPGIYDEEYLSYLQKILQIAEKKGISLFMDPHQDAWSRWTGGDGAPAWTLEKLGMILDRLDTTGAALTQQHYGAMNQGAPFPRMIWPANCNRYGAATLFTLFFAGNTYAPEVSIEGKSAQDWLQERYFAALLHCYRRLKECKALVGWEPMNEPHPGFIGYQDLGGLENYAFLKGGMPSPFQAMAAASGYPTEIGVYTTDVWGERKIGRNKLNPEGLSLFKEGFVCPWKQAGVWTDEGGAPRLLRNRHFAEYQGRPANFLNDFLKPFMNRFAERIREIDQKTLLFVEGIPNGAHPAWSSEDAPRTVNAFHWYDGPTLFTKFFRPWITVRPETRGIILGRKKVAAYFSQTLGEAVAWTRERMGDMPCLLGEFGLPFDMNGKGAYKTGDYRLHETALSMYYDAVDDHLLHSTIWNYTASNSHEGGDGWNDEDLSIFHAGEGRAMKGWLRPYPMATAGTPLKITWERKEGRVPFRRFTYRFKADPSVAAPTELFIPSEWFGTKPIIQVGTGHGERVPQVQVEYKPEQRRVFVSIQDYDGEVALLLGTNPPLPQGLRFLG
jgi:hypothetical protein